MNYASFLSVAAVGMGGMWVYADAVKETVRDALNGTLDRAGPVGDYIRDTYSNYNGFKSLLMSETHPPSNTLALHYIMVKILAITRYRQVTNFVEEVKDQLTHVRSTAVPCENGECKVEYYYNGHIYTVKIPTPEQFEELVGVEDERGFEVMAEIRQYLGPAHDFHGQRYTPAELGYETLTFINGPDTLTFSGDTPIVLDFTASE